MYTSTIPLKSSKKVLSSTITNTGVCYLLINDSAGYHIEKTKDDASTSNAPTNVSLTAGLSMTFTGLPTTNSNMTYYYSILWTPEDKVYIYIVVGDKLKIEVFEGLVDLTKIFSQQTTIACKRIGSLTLTKESQVITNQDLNGQSGRCIKHKVLIDKLPTTNCSYSVFDTYAGKFGILNKRFITLSTIEFNASTSEYLIQSIAMTPAETKKSVTHTTTAFKIPDDFKCLYFMASPQIDYKNTNSLDAQYNGISWIIQTYSHKYNQNTAFYDAIYLVPFAANPYWLYSKRIQKFIVNATSNITDVSLPSGLAIIRDNTSTLVSADYAFRFRKATADALFVISGTTIKILNTKTNKWDDLHSDITALNACDIIQYSPPNLFLRQKTTNKNYVFNIKTGLLKELPGIFTYQGVSINNNYVIVASGRKPKTNTIGFVTIPDNKIRQEHKAKLNLFDGDGIDYTKLTYNWYIGTQLVGSGISYTSTDSDLNKLLKVKANITDTNGDIISIESEQIKLEAVTYSITWSGTTFREQTTPGTLEGTLVATLSSGKFNSVPTITPPSQFSGVNFVGTLSADKKTLSINTQGTLFSHDTAVNEVILSITDTITDDPGYTLDNTSLKVKINFEPKATIPSSPFSTEPLYDLSKYGTISLDTRWDPVRDIDMHITTYNADQSLNEHIYYGNQASTYGGGPAIWLSRDDIAGSIGGEQMQVSVSQLPTNVTCGIVWAVHYDSYRGKSTETLGAVTGLKSVLLDNLSGNTVIHTYYLSNPSYSTYAVVLGRFFRFKDGTPNGTWWYESVGRAVPNSVSGPDDETQVASYIY